MRRVLAKFIASEDGATAIEYALITALISAVMIAGLSTLGDNLNSQMLVIGTSMN